jgi:hypothetical protein
MLADERRGYHGLIGLVGFGPHRLVRGDSRSADEGLTKERRTA